jgi:pimeloyl-ACP methyl ester carboxylesterase
MNEDQSLLERLESSNVDELTQLLSRPSLADEKTLRAYLTDPLYKRLHALALKQKMAPVVSPRAKAKRDGVVVLHGFLGSDLAVSSRDHGSWRILTDPASVSAGAFEKLRLSQDGLSELDPACEVRASGVLKSSYGALMLTLAQWFNVRAFAFDWRKDLRVSATLLRAAIDSWFPESQKVHLVGHGMGGLVARTYIEQDREHWDARRGRLVMLGTPNHGAIPFLQALTGVGNLLQGISILDPRRKPSELAPIVNSFVSLYQMLPSPSLDPRMARLYKTETYRQGLGVAQEHLDAARKHHERLLSAIDPERMVSVVGRGHPTVTLRIDHIDELSHVNPDADEDPLKLYDLSLDGDGTVLNTHSELERPSDKRKVPTYYVDEAHGCLPTSLELLDAIDEILLEDGKPNLPDKPPAHLGQRTLKGKLSEDSGERSEGEKLLRGVAGRLRGREGDARLQAYSVAETRAVGDALTRGFLAVSATVGEMRPVKAPFRPPKIKIRVIRGDIANFDDSGFEVPVDAIAIGHYLGSEPGRALRTIDKAVSLTLAESSGLPVKTGQLQDSELLLTQYIERGIIRGDLGQPFFPDDPRKPSGDGKPARVIAVAGMGPSGTFGVPEATVLARELCWSLGRLGKRHLVTPLIGAGAGNLSVHDAISAWIRGIKHALTGGLRKETKWQLEEITFIEKPEDTHAGASSANASSPRKVSRAEQIVAAIRAEKKEHEDRERLTITFIDGTKGPPITTAEGDAAAGSTSAEAPDGEAHVARVSIELEGLKYRFGAITTEASVPQREVVLDRRLVDRANDELVVEGSLDRLSELGCFLGKLLIPGELAREVFKSAPVVLILDSSTARIHWELVAQTPSAARARWEEEGKRSDDFDPLDTFLGTSRGVTRQLRTAFAPPPDPPPAPQRVLRVLVISDPAADAHLEGAEEEGIEVANLFEQFNTVHKNSKNRVEVVHLEGPHEASRTAVVRHLMLRSYDVVHFAGHCVYNELDPAASGWLFSGGEILSARELRRIDRIPRFIFSNACQSGVTPERTGERSVDLAPSFAEAFFERGVSNFVCTAWPINDVAARVFALTLYGHLLGIRPFPKRRSERRSKAMLEMYRAMMEARRALTRPEHGYGALTWGAYQHYGNPFFRLFSGKTMTFGNEERSAPEE